MEMTIQFTGANTFRSQSSNVTLYRQLEKKKKKRVKVQ